MSADDNQPSSSSCGEASADYIIGAASKEERSDRDRLWFDEIMEIQNNRLIFYNHCLFVNVVGGV
jgi:hypothetical protein